MVDARRSGLNVKKASSACASCSRPWIRYRRPAASNSITFVTKLRPLSPYRWVLCVARCHAPQRPRRRCADHVRVGVSEAKRYDLVGPPRRKGGITLFLAFWEAHEQAVVEAWGWPHATRPRAEPVPMCMPPPCPPLPTRQTVSHLALARVVWPSWPLRRARLAALACGCAAKMGPYVALMLASMSAALVTLVS